MDDDPYAIKKVRVYGVGGVGGYFGGKLADVNRINKAGQQVYFIARGTHLDAVVKAISPKVSQKIIIVPLLNGADIYERIRANPDKGIFHLGRNQLNNER